MYTSRQEQCRQNGVPQLTVGRAKVDRHYEQVGLLVST